MASSLYQARPIKRKRRTKAQVEQLEQQILNVLAGDHPQSIRHVFYRMTDPRLPEPVEKTDAGYNQVQHRIAVMRREGRLPYSWIADMSRRGYFTYTYTSASDFVLSMQHHYRADIWRDADCRCEVWCESRSLAAVLQDDCEEMAVDLFPCGGFPSDTFVYEAAEMNNRLADPRPLHIFYFGDYDPAGVLIDQSLQDKLEQHFDPGQEWHFHRLAINPDQIIEHDLPTKPRKRGDKRRQDIEETVEAEAMPANIMRDILRLYVEALLPANALQVAKIAEESEREALVQMAEVLGGVQ